jgi:hypothetical protein
MNKPPVLLFEDMNMPRKKLTSPKLYIGGGVVEIIDDQWCFNGKPLDSNVQTVLDAACLWSCNDRWAARWLLQAVRVAVYGEWDMLDDYPKVLDGNERMVRFVRKHYEWRLQRVAKKSR